MTASTSSASNKLGIILEKFQADLLSKWIAEQLASSSRLRDPIKESELREQSRQFLSAFQTASRSGNTSDISGPEWSPVRDSLKDLSRSRATQGVSPSDTASFGTMSVPSGSSATHGPRNRCW